MGELFGCICGDLTWFIGSGYIECIGCHRKYRLPLMPKEFNRHQDFYLIGEAKDSADIEKNKGQHKGIWSLKNEVATGNIL